MMGAGLTYWPHQRLWVQFSDYGADLAAGPLATNHHTQHDVGIKAQYMKKFHSPEGEPKI